VFYEIETNQAERKKAFLNFNFRFDFVLLTVADYWKIGGRTIQYRRWLTKNENDQLRKDLERTSSQRRISCPAKKFDE
jgi:hypothetical protein